MSDLIKDNLVNARLTLNYKKLAITAFAENLFKERYVLEFVPKAWPPRLRRRRPSHAPR